ncbi:hypothetical protein BGZ65_000262 [Modicella reniformis]|uniref:RING-CH-type domain-containing protein n=1 Tax=Modicella reniformis TaxID=1440133 RepID=A0A9P6J6G7_9FUNG|nr:hypothetical protein BGZ65_000262 [Modicella reniformis]
MSNPPPKTDADKLNLEANLLEQDDYDELVDEDWLDMVKPAQLAQPSVNTTPTPALMPGQPTNDDHQVPSFSSPIDKHSPEHPTAAASGTFKAAPATHPADDVSKASRPVVVSDSSFSPSSDLKVSTSTEPEATRKQVQASIPGSTSPTSTYSDSEFSLLEPAEPSAEPSRKNSLSSLTGFQGLTSTGTSPRSRGLDRDRDSDEHLPTTAHSPSHSDFEQVGSDHGEGSPGIESVSVRSSNNETPSCASSEGKGHPDDHDDEAVFSQDTNANIAIMTTATSSSTSAPIPSAKRATYRTTVEDATNSDDEHGSSRLTAGLQYRGSHTQQDDRPRSFTSSSTMPGAFNVGLDAELPSTSTAVNEPPVDERQCRICLGGAEEEKALGRLISPCLCKGSMKYVHVECLNAWRTRSPKPESHYKCDTCKYSFSFRRTAFARYLAHPMTLFVLTVVVFVMAVFAAGFAMKLLLYLMAEESLEFVYPGNPEDYDDAQLARRLKGNAIIFKTPDTLRAVFRIDGTHMVFGSFFVSVFGFLQLLLSTLWMGGGGGVLRIGGFGLGRRRPVRGEREPGVGGVLVLMILAFGLFKSVYMTYQLVHRASRHVLAKAEMMVLEVQ